MRNYSSLPITFSVSPTPTGDLHEESHTKNTYESHFAGVVRFIEYTLAFCLRPTSQSAVRTVPELGSLAREIGGERVTVVVFAKGTEDAHFIEAKPSFIKSLSECDAYVQVGLDLEIGWAPVFTARGA